MEVVAIRDMFINLVTDKVVPDWAKVHKDRIYTIQDVGVQEGMLMYQLKEISGNCWYIAENFVPLNKFLEEISIEELIEEPELV